MTGSRIIAREAISALPKDVIAKCYSGNVSRKRKLLEKQKAGTREQRQFGRVDITAGGLQQRTEDGRVIKWHWG